MRMCRSKNRLKSSQKYGGFGLLSYNIFHLASADSVFEFSIVLSFVRDAEVVQQGFVVVLRREAGVGQVTVQVPPLA